MGIGWKKRKGEDRCSILYSLIRMFLEETDFESEDNNNGRGKYGGREESKFGSAGGLAGGEGGGGRARMLAQQRELQVL